MDQLLQVRQTALSRFHEENTNQAISMYVLVSAYDLAGKVMLDDFSHTWSNTDYQNV